MLDHLGRTYEVRRDPLSDDEILTLWSIYKAQQDLLCPDSVKVLTAWDWYAKMKSLVDDIAYFYIDGKIIGAMYFHGLDVVEKVVAISGTTISKHSCPITIARLVRKVVDETFDRLSVDRIEAFGRNDNRAIRIFIARLGFTIEGVLRSYKIHDGKRVDYYVASRVR